MWLLATIVVLLSVLTTYLQLQAGNHNWQWRSFWIGTSVGFYIGAYALYYMHYEAKMDVIGAEMVYLIWTGFATFNFCAFFGMVSFSASAVFVAELFSHVRID